MRKVAGVVAIATLAACSASSAPDASDAGDAGSAGDAPSAIDSGIPLTSACAGDVSHCLSGTFTTKAFSAIPGKLEVSLYRVFPSGAIAPIQTTPLAEDGTFAFSGLDAWAHYYVQGTAGFGTRNAAYAVAALAGPFTVPTASASPIALALSPVSYEVLETGPGPTRLLQWVSARAFDPSTGAELTDATVSFVAGGVTTPLSYTTNAAGSKSYFVALASPAPLAMPAQITASHASLGASPLSIDIVTSFASFTPITIASPLDGAVVPANQPLVVSWAAQPLADYVLVALFVKQSGAFVGKYQSPSAIAPDTTTATIPASAFAAGSYLLNVNGAQSLCEEDGRGCAYALDAAQANLTAQ
jgi:hypothetical protein